MFFLKKPSVVANVIQASKTPVSAYQARPGIPCSIEFISKETNHMAETLVSPGHGIPCLQKEYLVREDCDLSVESRLGIPCNQEIIFDESFRRLEPMCHQAWVHGEKKEKHSLQPRK